MTINPVTEQTLPIAGAIHSAAWQASHRAFCSPDFVARHSPQAQTDYLRREMAVGKALYMLSDGEAKGIVTVHGALIENLYVLPSAQRRGYGSALLRFAMERCDGTPTLWVLSNNPARALYQRHGFAETGRRKRLNDALYEIEMSHRLSAIRQAEAASHVQAYTDHELFAPGSWLSKPVKTVTELLPLFDGYQDFCGLDLGCGVGRNSIPVARAFPRGRVDCVDILPLAIEKLLKNAERFECAESIQGIVSSIDDYAIKKERYDLILAVSSLEHVASDEVFCKKLMEIRDGLRTGGVFCLIMNTNVRETDKLTGRELLPQFEVSLTEAQLNNMIGNVFGGFELITQVLTQQHYDIPRESGLALLTADVATYVIKRKTHGGLLSPLSGAGHLQRTHQEILGKRK